MSVSGLGCLGSTLSVLDSVQPDPFAPIRSLSHLGPLLSVLELAHLGSPPLARSLACLGFALLVLDYLRLGLLLPLHTFGCADLLSSAFGPIRVGFLLPAPDHIKAESVTFLRSVARLESLASVLDFSHPGLLLLARSFVCAGFAVFLLDFFTLGLSFTLKRLRLNWISSFDDEHGQMRLFAAGLGLRPLGLHLVDP